MNKISQLMEYAHHFGIKLAVSKALSSLCFAFKKLHVRWIEDWLDRNYSHLVQYSGTAPTEQLNPSSPIWVMWWQGTDSMPRTVELAVQSIRRHAGEHPVIIITKDNYKRYTQSSEHFYSYVRSGKITLTHFSDYVRCELLYLHGGFWFDATLLMERAIPEWVYAHRLFSIKQGNVPVQGMKWDPSWSRNWTAYCLGGGRREPLFKYVIDFLDAYHERNDAMVDYLLIDRIIQFAYTHIADAREAIDAIPVNNTSCLCLAPKLNAPYGQFVTDDNTFLFKLTWKEQFASVDDSGRPTMYGHLLDEYGV